MVEDSSSRLPAEPEFLTANVDMKLAGHRLELAVTVPTAAVSAGALLPILYTLSAEIESQARDKVVQDGKQISCRQGCGACCRQLVPITDVEARRFAQLVEEFPEPRRSIVRNRFASATSRLEQAGLLESLRHPEGIGIGEYVTLGLAYFRLAIPCPFLESESCSIHPDRPLACREYLVTSPAKNCENPSSENIDRVEMPIRMSAILPRLDDPTDLPGMPWVSLVLSLELAATQPDRSSRLPGPEWMGRLFEKLAGHAVPPPST